MGLNPHSRQRAQSWKCRPLSEWVGWMRDCRKVALLMFPTAKAKPTDCLDAGLEELDLLSIQSNREAGLCAASTIWAEGNDEARFEATDTVATPDMSQ